MNRRGFLGRLATIGAALAGAGMVATKAGAVGRSTYQLLKNADGTVSFVDEDNLTFVGLPTREMLDMLADAYERGRAIESARAESRQALGLPLSREPA